MALIRAMEIAGKSFIDSQNNTTSYMDNRKECMCDNDYVITQDVRGGEGKLLGVELKSKSSVVTGPINISSIAPI